MNTDLDLESATVMSLSVTGWESLFSEDAGRSLIEMIAVYGAVVTVFVAPVTSMAAWLKGHRWAGVIGWLGWVLAMLVSFFPIRLLEDQPAADWLVQNFGSVGTYAAFTAVGFLVISLIAAVRLARPSSWWAQRRYRSEKYERAVERHGRARIKAR
jgi:hypothetical protein